MDVHRGELPKPFSVGYLHELIFNSASKLEEMSIKHFSGDSTFEVIEDVDKGKVLRTSSEAASAMLYEEIQTIPLQYHPKLKWEWKAESFPTNKKNEVLGSKEDNDYAGRVYALFKGSTLLTSEVIQYLWDDHFEEGVVENSPFSNRVKMVVVESGRNEEGDGWVIEERDLYEDYVTYFGKEPEKPLGAIAVMSDSDDTKTSSSLLIRGISISSDYLVEDMVPPETKSNIQPANVKKP